MPIGPAGIAHSSLPRALEPIVRLGVNRAGNLFWVETPLRLASLSLHMSFLSWGEPPRPSGSVRSGLRMSFLSWEATPQTPEASFARTFA
jgi:hypothetical protein